MEYELTELGRSLLEPPRAVRRWAEAHVPEIQAANGGGWNAAGRSLIAPGAQGGRRTLPQTFGCGGFEAVGLCLQNDLR